MLLAQAISEAHDGIAFTPRLDCFDTVAIEVRNVTVGPRSVAHLTNDSVDRSNGIASWSVEAAARRPVRLLDSDVSQRASRLRPDEMATMSAVVFSAIRHCGLPCPPNESFSRDAPGAALASFPTDVSSIPARKRRDQAQASAASSVSFRSF
jgi:hypothetical protein